MKKETNTTTKGELFENEHFTKGQWTHFSSNGIQYITDKDGRYLATVHSLEDGKNNTERRTETLANTVLICQAVNERQKLLDTLKKAHKQLHDMCNMYCRDKDGYLNHEPGGWDAELDIEIETIINNAKNIQP